MDKLYIIIPAYNEEENIINVVKSWYPILEKASKDSKLVIINDGSKDNTQKILDSIKNNYPNLVVIEKENGGHGSAVYAGYKYGVDNHADFIFQTDSDMQTLSSEFDLFWEKRNNFTAVFGYRPTRGDGHDRAFVEKIVCLIVRLFFHTEVPDANAPFRLFKRETLEKYLKLIDPDYFLPNIILTAFYARSKEKIEFLPITFLAREKGEQTINIKKIIRIGFKSLKDFKQYNKRLSNLNRRSDEV
ncbi:MAG: glycosyltransferase family 2 protein [Lachnospiraceae bacterium]|nr:glycosyltransferase family 2 protein [Lachnospiraceae bacterium]